MLRSHAAGLLREGDAGQQVTLAGWVARRRDHGGVIFIDLRDASGIAQVVFRDPQDTEVLAQAHRLRAEFCVSVAGVVEIRPEGNANPEIATGEIEVNATSLTVLGECAPLPFQLDEPAGEELRLKYRYLDLRRDDPAAAIRLRSRVNAAARAVLARHDFVEIETPTITRSTPEGARDFLVPARLHPGSFYALPQSPQLFKQLLMVAGMERYYQIARCYRDEDFRADRQPEFTQLDMEMSFVDAEDIIAISEEVLTELWALIGYRIPTPIPRIGYAEAMRRFGTDKPDLRFGLELVECTDFFSDTTFRVFQAPYVGEVVDEAEASQEVLHKANSLQGLAFALAYQGELSAARAAADAALEAAELGEYFAGMGYSALTTAALAAGDVQTAQHASEAAWRNLSLALPLSAAVQRAFNAQAALAGGDLSAARRWCDDAVQSMTGHHLAMALATRARIAVAEGKREEAERDAHKALACAAESGAHLDLPDVLECLAGLASDAGTHHAAARLFGAAEAIRQQIGSVRFAIYRSDYVQSVTALRDAMGEKDFDAAWAEGAALSIKETIAYAQRGHSWRKRPATGWESLTPTEIDVVRLVGEGLANKDIATRLFVSPRTVQTHLTHVYTKLGFTSRLQLAQAAARRT